MSYKANLAFRREMTSGVSGGRTVDQARAVYMTTKHRRYMSGWEDDDVRIDVADVDAAESDVQIIVSGKEKIEVSGTESGYATIILGEQPEIFLTLKALLNEDCHKNNRGDVFKETRRTVAAFIRLIAWMYKCGRHRLRDVEPTLIKALAAELARGGWWTVLDYDARLDRLLEKAANDSALRASLEGTGHLDTFTCNMDVIGAELRLPIVGNKLPLDVVVRIQRLTGSAKPVEKTEVSPRVSQQTLHKTFVFLNRCALIDGFDSFGERPFPAPSKRARELCTGEHRDSRTANLGVNDVVTIFTEALRWIYVCSDGVIMLCETARYELERCVPDALGEIEVMRRVTSRVLVTYEEVAERFGLPPGLRTLARDVDDNLSLHSFILKLQFSCAIAVLFNHGRRREEVLGCDAPYGLYRGCLTRASDPRGGSILDIYIEKTLQRYASMWANEIVERAVDVLERLGQTFRPLGSRLLSTRTDLRDARQDKLFVQRHFSYAGFKGEPFKFRFRQASKMFFENLDVSISSFSASHIYRRCFSILYMYRHDHPVLMALSRHLCHLTLEATRVYTTDSTDVEYDRSIEVLFPAIDKDDAGFRDEFERVRSEYFQEKILQILTGESVGGAFARIVARIGRKLESNASFREASIAEKARQTREAAEKEGYAPEPKANTSCCAGSADKTKRQANCYNEEQDRVCPDTASAEMCENCIHAITTENHRSTLEREIEDLNIAASDTKRPIHLRLAARDAAEGLMTILTRERESAAEMQTVVNRLVNGWKPIVFREKSHG